MKSQSSTDRHRFLYSITPSRMTRTLTALFTFLVIILSGTICPISAEKIVVDQAGRRVTIPDTIRSIVSLAPSITEIVFALEKEGLLRGVTQFSDYPEQARNIPQVGSYVRLDLEKIVSLQPDICIAVKDGNPIATINRLTDLAIPVYAIDVYNIPSVIDSILGVGKLLDAEQQAEALTNQMKRRLDTVTQAVKQADHAPTVFMQISVDPIVSAGTDTFLDELIQLAGGRNLAAGSTAYPRFSKEQIIRLDPEILIIGSMTDNAIIKVIKREWETWPQVSAVKHQRIHLINSDLTNRPGPRLIDGLEILANIIHPDLVPQASTKE